MDTLARRVAVPFGGAGRVCSVNVEESSCNVKSLSSVVDVSEGLGRASSKHGPEIAMCRGPLPVG